MNVSGLGSETSKEPGAAVRVWEDEITLPTYQEGLPDVNPPFDLFNSRSFVSYPYTTRESMTDQKSLKTWRALNLENEYLKVIVLPDLGGRLYSCVDKANGCDMFFANPSIKYAQVAYRGAWVALGIEFNFPVSHNWVTVSPVDYRIEKSADGSGAIWVGSVDRVYGMIWRVGLRLRPGSSLLEQTVTLYNKSSLRRRFYWWNNVSVKVEGDSQIIYPMRYSAAHGFADIDTWPVDSSGADLSFPKNHARGWVSRFAHASREPFMGIYHPHTDSGMVHFASIDEVPAKKIWSWGWDAEGRDWFRALSDEGSPYVEVQAGLFRNQETYAFLEPQQFLRFQEFYMPVRGIAGFSRANLNGVVHVRREPCSTTDAALRVGVNVNRELSGGALRIKQGDKIVASMPINLRPSQVFDQTYPELKNEGPYGVELVSADGRVLLVHTENQYEFLPWMEVATGPQASYRIPQLENRSEGDFIELAQEQELKGRLLPAYDTCRQGLMRFPHSIMLNKSAGILAVQLKRYGEAVEKLSKVLDRDSNEMETQYYLGNAWFMLGDRQKPRALWQDATLLPAFRPAALMQLALLSAQRGELHEALRQIRKGLTQSPNMIRAGTMEVALLRKTGDTAQAVERLDAWLRLDPPNSFLRCESVKLGRVDEPLWRHLAADPERVLEIAVDYMALGFYDDALELLDFSYPSDGVFGEPGAVRPQNHPIVAYYRGYCREKLDISGCSDFELASRQSTRYVFPNRPETMDVLRTALGVNPNDATARVLLGALYLSGGMVDPALREWKMAERINPKIPVLHRNIGLTMLHGKADPAGALRVLADGLKTDPMNVDLYLGLDQCLSLLGQSVDKRIQALLQYPNQDELPSELVHKLVLAHVEAGRPQACETLFRNRFFPREEFGTNVRLVYLEVQLQKALALARTGHCESAMAIAASFGKPAADLPFTHNGLEVIIATPRFQFYLGELQALCGSRKVARNHWVKAAGINAYQQVYFAYLAARHLGEAAPGHWHNRLSIALAETESSMAENYHFPGLVAYARGLILRALDRKAEANECLRSAFLLPDKGMSHYLSRIALRDP